MFTPASWFSRYRPLFLGLTASACGALCLATPACGGGAGTPSKEPPGSQGMAGTGASAGSGPVAQAGSSAGPTSAMGGAGGGASGGAASGGSAGASPFGGSQAVEGSASRPQIPAAAAADFTVLKYLEKVGAVGAPSVDGWDPTAGIDLTSLTAKYQVAKSGGTHSPN